MDIEGTTTPIDFVYTVLFPYAKERLESYMASHRDDKDVWGSINELELEHEKETDSDVPAWNSSDPSPSALAYLRWLMAKDRKSTTLKKIQGFIWKFGYESGEIKGQLFPEVADTLRGWHEDGLTLAIFSSGSILAQKLIFGYSEAGDLTPLLSNYFDTTTGPKRVVESYRKIASELGHLPSDILFLSDVSQELEAAAAAGFQTRQCLRPGNTAPQDHNFVAIQGFDEMELHLR